MDMHTELARATSRAIMARAWHLARVASGGDRPAAFLGWAMRTAWAEHKRAITEHHRASLLARVGVALTVLCFLAWAGLAGLLVGLGVVLVGEQALVSGLSVLVGAGLMLMGIGQQVWSEWGIGS